MRQIKKLIEAARRNKLAAALFLIILGTGIFLRSYHFSDWLHFEIDQTYDTRLVSPAVENGISSLPLLGPTAGGGRSLRLGPAFYYLEYLSAKIFRNNPAGHAAQILIWSILSLPLFYLFCRRYFSRKISLSLMAVFSFSLYLVLYSRFSWSPNILPFLVLAVFYCLLRGTSRDELQKEKWFLVSVFLGSLASQIHFISFFSVPFVFAFFLLVKRPRFKFKIWAAAAAVFLVIYSPVVISDIKTHGQNLNYFMERLGLQKTDAPETKEESGSSKKIGEKIFQDARYNALEFFLIISGTDTVNGKRLKGYDAGILCKTCKGDAPARILGFLFFGFGLFFLVFNLIREKDAIKKDFLILCALWFAAVFLFLLFITYDGFYIYPRFFLIIGPLAVIFLGFILEKIMYKKNILTYSVFVLAILLLSYLNLSKIFRNFDQLRKAPFDTEARFETEDIFPDNSRVVYLQYENILDYMLQKQKQNGYPIYLKSIHEFDPVFWYLLEKRNVPFDEFKYDPDKEKNVYREGNYFLISSDLSKKIKNTGEYWSAFDITGRNDFGSLYVLDLSPKEEAVTSEKQDLPRKALSEQSEQISKILTWKKLFN